MTATPTDCRTLPRATPRDKTLSQLSGWLLVAFFAAGLSCYWGLTESQRQPKYATATTRPQPTAKTPTMNSGKVQPARSEEVSIDDWLGLKPYKRRATTPTTPESKPPSNTIKLQANKINVPAETKVASHSASTLEADHERTALTVAKLKHRAPSDDTASDETSNAPTQSPESDPSSAAGPDWEQLVSAEELPTPHRVPSSSVIRPDNGQRPNDHVGNLSPNAAIPGSAVPFASHEQSFEPPGASFDQLDPGSYPSTENTSVLDGYFVPLGDSYPQTNEPDFHVSSPTELLPHEVAASDPVDRLAWWVTEMRHGLLFGRPLEQVSLDELVLAALDRSPQVQVFATQPQIDAANVGIQDAVFDWATFMETEWKDTSDPVGSDLDTGGARRLRDDRWTYRTGVRKLTRSGGDFELGQEFGHRNTNSVFFNPRDQGNSRLVLSYRQPLLQGAGRWVTESQILLATIDANRSLSDSLANVQAFILEVVTRYWELYFQRGALVLQQHLLERAQRTVAQLEARRDLDADPNQIIRAEAAAAARRTSVIQARTAVVNAQESLLNLVVGPDFQRNADAELLPLDNPVEDIQCAFLEEEAGRALRLRPEVQAAYQNLEAAYVQHRIALNGLLPQLNAFLETYVAGLRGNSDVGGAWLDQFREGEPSYTAGLNFSVPINNRAAKYRSQQQWLAVQQVEQLFQQVIGDVALDVRIAVRDIQRLYQETSAAREAVTKAKQELNYIKTRFELQIDRGKSGSLFLEDLLQSQQRLTDAEIAYLRRQADYAIAVVGLRKANGMLLREDTPLPSCTNMIADTERIEEANQFAEAVIGQELRNGMQNAAADAHNFQQAAETLAVSAPTPQVSRPTPTNVPVNYPSTGIDSVYPEPRLAPIPLNVNRVVPPQRPVIYEASGSPMLR